MVRSSSNRRNKAGKSPGMAPQRILGICLLVVGVILLAVGFSMPQTTELQAVTASRNATTYILGGIAVTLAGFILALLGLRTGKATR